MKRKGRRNVELRMVNVEDILPNPYRNIARYPISEEKVESLLKSIENSGFWDGSIQGRPNKNKIEIAFGHHRVAAAKRVGIKQVGIVVADRTNADMLRMMADENREEFQHDSLVTVETIRAVIEAYGRGEIELEPVDPKARKDTVYHVAPLGATYTLGTVARFLRWTKKHGEEREPQPTNACSKAFDAYRMIESTEGALNTLTPSERSEVAVVTVTTAARVARSEGTKLGLTPAKLREAEREAANTAVKAIKEESGFKARSDATQYGKAAANKAAGKKKKPIPVELYVTQLVNRWKDAVPSGAALDDFKRLLPLVEHLEDEHKQALAKVLEQMLEREITLISRMVTAFRASGSKKITELLKSESAVNLLTSGE